MNGLELIKHTVGGGVMTATTTGGSVDLVKNGKIEFTNAAQVHVDKCFDSTCENYLIVIRYADTNSQLLGLRMRASGNDNSTASSYVVQGLRANGGTVDAFRQARSDIYISNRSIAQSGVHLYVYGPALAQPTAMRSNAVSDQDGGVLNDYAGTHNQSTAYDGFTIIPGDQSVTGSLTIYGFTKGTP